MNKRNNKIEPPLISYFAYLKDGELDDLIAKLTMGGIVCSKTENHDCVVRLENKEVNFLREITIWWSKQ